MNSLDVIFLILMVGSVIYSLIRGLVREIFSLLAVLLGLLGASYGYMFAASWLRHWIANQTVTHVLGFVLLFILIVLIITLLGRASSAFVKKMDLNWADHLGGAAFGFLKAVFVIALIILVLTVFLPPKSKVIAESKISPKVMAIVRGLSVFIPKKLQFLYEEKAKDVKKYWAAQEPTGGKLTRQGGI